jgi:hypothetical protein
LVVRWVLSTQFVAAEQGQHHNLFQSRCKVKGQVCHFIKDGGSCNNIVSALLVEKLGLQPRHHPHPYHMQWLNNSGTVKVSAMIRLLFSIGDYHAEVDCDIVPMQACHFDGDQWGLNPDLSVGTKNNSIGEESRRSQPDYNHPGMLRLSDQYTNSCGWCDLVELDNPATRAPVLQAISRTRTELRDE